MPSVRREASWLRGEDTALSPSRTRGFRTLAHREVRRPPGEPQHPPLSPPGRCRRRALSQCCNAAFSISSPHSLFITRHILLSCPVISCSRRQHFVLPCAEITIRRGPAR